MWSPSDGWVNRGALRSAPLPPIVGAAGSDTSGYSELNYLACGQWIGDRDVQVLCGLCWYLYHSIPKARSFCSASAVTSWAACHVRRAWLVWQDKVTNINSTRVAVKEDPSEYLYLECCSIRGRRGSTSRPILIFSFSSEQMSLSKALQINTEYLPKPILTIYCCRIQQIRTKCFSFFVLFWISSGFSPLVPLYVALQIEKKWSHSFLVCLI